MAEIMYKNAGAAAGTVEVELEVEVEGEDEPGKCIFTGAPATERVLLAKAY